MLLLWKCLIPFPRKCFKVEVCVELSERELSKETLKCEVIVELSKDAQIMKIMTSISPYYPKLVKEFIVNIFKHFNKAGRKYYKKVHIRRCCIGFSHVIINE